MNKISIQNNRTTRRGFTLVELLFACAILGFMLTITLVTFIGVFRFYLWSRTTRTTQEASRQVLNTMTREIQARQIVSPVGGSSLCLKDPVATPTEKSLKLFLRANTIQTQSYTDVACQNATAGSAPTIISANAVSITSLTFAQVNGPGPDVAKSVTIDMQATNGIPETTGPNAGKCRPTDNFCDQASFTTAVMQR
jgi:prepilin-type N-terminal cleavage/methylation domain-containing protein